jgi:apolipoprotein N-acyltransferase
MKENEKAGRLDMGLAVCSGLLLTGSFPKIGASWLAWFCLVPLLFALKNLPLREGFRVGFIAGIVHYLSLLYWLVYTMNTYGHLPVYLGVTVLFLFSAYLALYTAVFSAMLIRAAGIPPLIPIVVPVVWVFLEYVRSFLMTGFPWALMGYSQFKTLQIIQISDICGVYGVSFLAAASNAVIFMGALFIIEKRWRGKAVSRKALLACLGAAALLFGGVWHYGKWRIRAVEKMVAVSPAERISVVQGNIEQTKKWAPSFQKETIKRYDRLSRDKEAPASALVIWPETAMPFYFGYQSELSEMVREGIRKSGSDFIIGSPSFIRTKAGEAYYNSAYLVGSDGKISGQYDKVRLVPFGEYVPFKRWLPFLGKMVAQVGDFKPGEAGNTLAWKVYRLGVQICYEIIFPNLSRAMVRNGSTLMVNITNDAWFGRTGAPFQHFSMAVFRAVENRRSLARAANTGISGFVDPVGRIVGQTLLFEEALLTREMPMIDRVSFYSRFGDLFAMICTAASVLLMALGDRVRRKSNK